MEFSGQVVIVTGAARGIGRAVAVEFARCGANVALMDLKASDLTEAVQEVTALGVEAMACEADVSKQEQVEAAVQQVVNRFGRVDVLVNNAGYMERGLVEDSTADHWHRMLDINLLGPVFCSQAVIPTMKKTGGSIINCSSILGTFPNTGSAAYGAAKQGVILLTRVMAAELAPYGIRVNCYSPGVANTAFAAEVIKTRGASKVQQIALKRFGEPEDLATVIRFLASKDANYVTGQTIGIDGGIWVTQTPTRTWPQE